MTSTLTITHKGVTLGDDLLSHTGVRPGQKVTLSKLPDGRIEIKSAPSGKISDVFGLLRRENGPLLSIEEINEATAKGWAGER